MDFKDYNKAERINMIRDYRAKRDEFPLWVAGVGMGLMLCAVVLFSVLTGIPING